MVNQQLVDYIKTQAKNGYPVNQIANYLMQQGYSQEDVNSAVNALSKPSVDKKTLIQRIVIVIMVLIISYMVYYNYFRH